MPTARIRTAVVPVVHCRRDGSDLNDGLTEATAVKTPQIALDMLARGFDFDFRGWQYGPAVSRFGYMGRRPAARLQLGPAPLDDPHMLSDVAYLDGLGCAGPIEVVGNPANPQSVVVEAKAVSKQGWTAQDGAVLYLDGFSMIGDDACTLVNTLGGGRIGVGKLLMGPRRDGAPVNSPFGAADGGTIEFYDAVWLWGAGFGPVVTCLQRGEAIFAPGHSFNFMNALAFESFVNMDALSIACTYGSPFLSGGVGLPGVSGVSARAARHSHIGFDVRRIPGTFNPANVDATSSVINLGGTPGGGLSGDGGGPPQGTAPTTTWNPADKGPNVVLVEGNTRASMSATGWQSVRSVQSWSSGSVEATFQIQATAYGSILGLADAAMAVTNYPGGSGNSAAVEFAASNVSSNQFKSGFLTVVNHPTGAFASGDTVKITVDFENGTASLSRNGVPYPAPWVAFPPHSTLFLAVAHYQPGESCKLLSATWMAP